MFLESPILKKAEILLYKSNTPLLLKELAWRTLMYGVRCGSANPVSFALRPLAAHRRVRIGMGVALVALTMYGAGSGSLVSLASDKGGGWEIATRGTGEVSLKTVEAVVNPLPRVEISQRYWLLHPGLDMKAGVGTPIKPVVAGEVIKVDNGRLGYGRHVVVDHGNGYTSLYAHMSKIRVEEGQRVGTGDVLGEVGSTGRSTGPHLHLEIHENGKSINPQAFLRLQTFGRGRE